ncbi:MAG: glycoside hydrolase family 3 N-terminal domain-containing protein [Gammaproteobacteria bacterium]|nr:glycoside hydrolase family 3 N-terminal domain-containing protein [Gammaproteobacteria bacterium]
MNEGMIKHKIGQMLMVGFPGKMLDADHPVAQAILRNQLGGVILFDYDFQTKTFHRNIESPEQLKLLTKQLKHYASNAMPLLIGVDYEGGKVNRLKEDKGFPKTFTAAEVGCFSQDKIKDVAETMAATLSAMGINLVFSPVVDVNLNPHNPVIGQLARSFSSEPMKVIQCAEIFSQMYHEQGIISVLKHFPGHGSSMHDTHLGLTDVTGVWQEIELEPYRYLLPKLHHTSIVMTSHIVHKGLDSQGYPASLSHAMTQNLLRETLQFGGVVVTDDMQMKAITARYDLPEAISLAINAGADIVVFGNQLLTEQIPTDLIEVIYSHLKNNKISLDRIEESYQRIVELKNLIY